VKMGLSLGMKFDEHGASSGRRSPARLLRLRQRIRRSVKSIFSFRLSVFSNTMLSPLLKTDD